MIPMHHLSSIQFSLHGISRLPPFESRLRGMIYSSQWNLRSGVTEHQEALVFLPLCSSLLWKHSAAWVLPDETGGMKLSHPLFPAEGISDQPQRWIPKHCKWAELIKTNVNPTSQMCEQQMPTVAMEANMTVVKARWHVRWHPSWALRNCKQGKSKGNPFNFERK